MALAAPTVSVSPPSLLDDPPRTVPGPARPVELASDGTGWLFAYAPSSRFGRPPGLHVRAISAEGVPVGRAESIGQCSSPYKAELVFDGHEYLLSYIDACPNPTRWNLARIGSDGAQLAKPQTVADAISVSQVTLAGGDGAALLVLCSEEAECRTKVMTNDGQLHAGQSVAGISRPAQAAGFSDGTYLVAFSHELRFFGLDGRALDVSVTPPVDVPQFAPSTIVSDSEGFVVAWTEAEAIRFAHVDFDGTVRLAPFSMTSPRGPLRQPRMRRFGSVLRVSAQEWKESCDCGDTYSQRLNAALEPVGSLDLAIEGAGYAEPSAAAAFGVTGLPDGDGSVPYQRGRLLHFDDTVTGDTLRDVSEQPHAQDGLRGAPAKDGGWLVTWQESYDDRSSSVIKTDLRGRLLLPNGKPAGASMLLRSGDWEVAALSRGRDEWLMALSHNVGGDRPDWSLAILEDGSETLHPVSGSERPLDFAGDIKMASSDRGWLAVYRSSVEGTRGLVATRLGVDGRELDSTVISDAYRFDVRLEADHYAVCWTDTYARCRDIPLEGPIPDVTPTKLFKISAGGLPPVLTGSGSDWWAIVNGYLYENGREPQFVNRLGSPIDLLALGGVLLVTLRDNDTFNSLLAVAAPAQGLTLGADITQLSAAHFSERQGNRALLLGCQSQPYDSFPRAMTAVVEVLDTSPAPDGGVGGAAAGDGGASDLAGGGGGDVSSSAGSPTAEGGAEPIDSSHGPTEPDSDACSCRVLGSARSDAGGVLALLALVGALARRRRRHHDDLKP